MRWSWSPALPCRSVPRSIDPMVSSASASNHSSLLRSATVKLYVLVCMYVCMYSYVRPYVCMFVVCLFVCINCLSLCAVLCCAVSVDVSLMGSQCNTFSQAEARAMTRGRGTRHEAGTGSWQRFDKAEGGEETGFTASLQRNQNEWNTARTYVKSTGSYTSICSYVQHKLQYVNTV